jgi:hypothetical protein
MVQHMAVQHQAARLLLLLLLAAAHQECPSQGTDVPPQLVTLLTDLLPAAALTGRMPALLLRWPGAAECAAARVLRLRCRCCCRGLPARLWHGWCWRCATGRRHLGQDTEGTQSQQQ